MPRELSQAVKAGAVIILALSVLGGVTASLFIQHQSRPRYGVIDIARACSFLKEQYVPEAGLLRAALSTQDVDHYRVYINDNLLAAEALATCGDEELSERVMNTINSQYCAYKYSGRQEVLLGIPIDEPPKARAGKVLGSLDNMTIIAEVEVNHSLRDWRSYADWLFLEALNSLIKGNKSKAMTLFEEGMRFFDGRGFRDKAYNKTKVFDTYKIGLAIYTYRALGEPSQYSPYISIMLGILRHAQDNDSGGIFTGYKALGEAVKFSKELSDVNVETTSVIILSLYGDLPEQDLSTSDDEMVELTTSPT